MESNNSISDNIDITTIKILYKNLIDSLPALVIVTTVLIFALSNSVNSTYLIMWYTAFALLSAMRAGLAVWYTYTKYQTDYHRLHKSVFIINTSLLAFLWGLLGSVMMPEDPHTQMLVIIFIAGVTAGAVISLIPSYLASALCATFTTIPLSIWLLLQHQDTAYFSTAIAVITYWIFLLVVARRGHKLYADNLKLTFENINLFENLSQANFHLTKSYDQLKDINNALLESEERFRQSFDYAAIGMALVSKEGHWLKVNQSFSDLLGYTEKEMLQLDFQKITYPDDLHTDEYFLEQMLEGKLYTYQIEKRCLRKNGGVLWVLLSRALVRDAENKPLYFITQIQNIDAQKKAESELQHIAYHDPLTELDNRKMLEIKFIQAVSYADRHNYKIAVLFIDLDYFKEINDNMGHDAGDQVLKIIAKRLQNCKRDTDILARLGGDEFILLATELLHMREVNIVVEKVYRALSEEMVIKGNTVAMHASIGVSLYPQDGMQLQTLLKHADIALYKVKQTGRNNFKFYSPDIESNAKHFS